MKSKPTSRPTSMTNRRNTALLIAALSLSTLAIPAADIHRYDASLGTLPQAQGFIYYETPGGRPPAVEGGALHLFGNPVVGGYQFWYATNAVFSFATNTYTMEITVQVLSATDFPTSVDPGNTGRGFQFEAIDSAGNQLAVHIGTNSLTLGGYCETRKVDFNAADSNHTYRTVIDSNGVTLFIDNTKVSFSPINEGRTLSSTQYWNRVYFGDGSGWVTSEALVRRFRFGTTPQPRLSIYTAVELVFSTEANLTYQLQYVAEAGMTNWANLGTPIAGDGTTKSIFDSTRTSPGRIYRLQISE